MPETSPLTHLRRLCGLAPEELARLAGCRAEDVLAAERGQASEPVLAQILGALDVDVDDWWCDRVQPAADAAQMFFFQGPAQVLSAADLVVLNGALRRARVASLRAPASASFRLGLSRVSLVGGSRADAAKQGYRLARSLRAALEMPTEPVSDIGRLVADQLAIVAAEARFSSDGVHACAVLDAQLGGAALVLDADDAWRQNNPLVARVFVAHELCHLLYDPVRAQGAQVSVDGGGAGPSGDDYEARARGFAAEFLIPESGVLGLLGAVTTSDLDEGLAWVDAVRRHFATPWEIAAWHLKNLGYYANSLARELVNRGSSADVEDDEITLADLSEAEAEAAEEELRAEVRSAREAATKLLERLEQERRQTARSFLEAEVYAASGPRAAASAVASWLDDHLIGGRMGHVAAWLAEAVADRMPAPAISAALMVTRDAPPDLDAAREAFWQEAEASLAHVHGWDAPRVERLKARLL